MEIQKLLLSAASMTVFQNIKQAPIFELTYKAVESLKKNSSDFCCCYAALCKYRLEHMGENSLFYDEIIYDSNIFAQMSQKNSLEDMPLALKNAVDFDIHTVKLFADLTAEEILKKAKEIFVEERRFIETLPSFPAGTPFLLRDSGALYEIYRKTGFGYFAKGRAFCVEDGKAVLIENPDPTRLSDLKGYHRQKQAIIANTLAFLNGIEANNILLYGDKGTGKSSTVKAIVNEYADRGLKIVELKLNQIDEFQKICDLVEGSPFQFIIFLDDLSFDKEDDNFTALKAFIEGGLAGKTNNVLVYATSNRRHLVRESFADRNGDELHVRDTLETITSLSDRFGLEITFSVPDKDEYLEIVDILAEENGIDMEKEELHMLAERFAIRRNGRSPRTARQFINHQLSVACL